MALNHRPDLIVLDLMMPKLSGVDVLEALRREGLEMQIIVLSARSLESDKVDLLRRGADDYVTKPFSLRELLARVEAALRRPRKQKEKEAESPLRFGNIEVDRALREVRKEELPIKLTTKEYDLLLFLSQNPNRPYTRAQLLRRVWGYDYEGTERPLTISSGIFAPNLRTTPNHPCLLKPFMALATASHSDSGFASERMSLSKH